jgi:uncharacterized membrane protein
MPGIGIEPTSQTLTQPQLVPKAGSFRASYDLWLLVGLALLGPGLLLLPAWLAALRAPLGMVLVLFAPGYALAAAVFPRRADLDGLARAALSFGLSVAVIPLLALLLDRLPWGIRPLPIALALAATILVLAAAAFVRRARLAPSDTAYAPPVPDLAGWWRRLDWRAQRLYVGGALLLLLVAGAGIGALLLAEPSGELTEFYVLGSGGLAEDYPRAAVVGEEVVVTLGVANRERAARSYRVEIWAVDPWDADRRQLVGQAGPFTLAHGQTIEQPVSWRMPWAGDDQTVEFLLFSGDDPHPYRQLRLGVDVRVGR